MPSHSNHWITLHRIRFANSVAALKRQFPVVASADCWRFCPEHTMGDNNLPTWDAPVWAALGIWNTREEAKQVLAEPTRFMPDWSEAEEMWHALALPVQHRGQVKWRSAVETDQAIAPSEDDPGGPLAVLTSASFDDPTNPDELPRISRFAVKVSEAIEFLSQQPGNLRSGVFNGGYDGREGFTLTLWNSDDDMLKAAYHSGHHRKLMDESRDGSTFDRSSFTRLRIIHSQGSWSGDPWASAA